MLQCGIERCNNVWLWAVMDISRLFLSNIIIFTPDINMFLKCVSSSDWVKSAIFLLSNIHEYVVHD